MISIKKLKFFLGLLFLIHITFPLISKADDQELNRLYSRIESLKESIIMYSYLENELSNLSKNINNISTTDIKKLIKLSQTISDYIKLEIKTDPNDRSYRDGLNILINKYKDTLNNKNIDSNNSFNDKKPPYKNYNDSISERESLIKEKINSTMRVIKYALNDNQAHLADLRIIYDLRDFPYLDFPYYFYLRKIDPIWIMYDQDLIHRFYRDTFYGETREELIILPISSLMFFEDLCVAYAWLTFNNKYHLEILKQYISRLKYNKQIQLYQYKYNQLSVLENLNIPHNALSDPRVNNLSLLLRDSGYMFILAHQLGIIYNRGSENKKNIYNEANRFALEIMLRADQLPDGALGAMLFYQLITYYLPNQFDFSFNRNYFLPSSITPQVTAEQLNYIAAILNNMKPSFSQIESNDIIIKSVANILELANFLNDLGIQIEIYRKYNRVFPK